MAMALPKVAPLLTPKMDGSARGFEKTVCMTRPPTAKAAPDNIAVSISGRRDCKTMNLAEEESGRLPARTLTTSFASRETGPTN